MINTSVKQAIRAILTKSSKNVWDEVNFRMIPVTKKLKNGSKIIGHVDFRFKLVSPKLSTPPNLRLQAFSAYSFKQFAPKRSDKAFVAAELARRLPSKLGSYTHLSGGHAFANKGCLLGPDIFKSSRKICWTGLSTMYSLQNSLLKHRENAF